MYAIIVACICFLNSAFAQDGVRIAASAGTADPSAMLDITSANRGLLIPRVTLVGLTNSTSPVNNPAVGLLVYNLGSVTVPSVGFYYWTGTAWVQLTAGGFSGAGTLNYVTKWTASNALGSSVIFDNGTNVGIGTTAPGAILDIGDGSSQCCATQTPNLSLNQNSVSNTKMAWLQFHNGGEAEAYIRLAGGGSGARAGQRRLEIGDSQSALTSLTATGNIGIGTTLPAVALDATAKTTAIGLPGGTTAQRPSGANGYFRYNSSNSSVEMYTGGAWQTVYTTFGTLANPLTSTTQADALGLPSGDYYFNFPGSTGVAHLTYQASMANGVGYVKVFASPYGGYPSVNFVGRSFPWTRFLVQSSDGSTRATAFFSSTRLFNTDGQLTLSTGGTHTGYRVFIGSGGGMGIYNSVQQVCNWGNSSGAVGAGYNGSTCSSWPTMLWGTGTGSATYTAYVNMFFEIWIAQ